MLYRVLRFIVLIFYKLILRIKVVGAENVPKTGGVVLSANHRSNHDPLILAVSQKRSISFMAKESVLKIPVIGFILKHAGIFPVKRGTGDIGAVKKAIEILKAGNMLSLFPEGTRNKTAEVLAPFQMGAAMVASKSGGVIVPVGIIGSYRLFSGITVIYNPPIDPKDYGEKPDNKLITEDLKKAILRSLEEYK